MHIRLAVQPRQHLLEKSLDFRLRAPRTELGDPDGAAVSDGAGVADVLLEVLGVPRGVVLQGWLVGKRGERDAEFGRAYPVDGDEVYLAAVGLLEEHF